MNTYVQDGKTLTLTAPYARASGEGALVGSVFGVATAAVANGAEGEFQVEGVVTIAKTSAQAWTQGQKIYWDNVNKRCDSDSTVGQLIGVATAAAANPSSTGTVKLLGNVPSTAEGPQGAIVALTDNTGGSGTHDDTLADGLTATALTENAGAIGGVNDGDLPDLTVTATSPGTGADATTWTGAQCTAAYNDIVDLTEAARELATKINTLVTDVTTQNQNDSDLAQKILEIRTALIAAGILSA